VLPECVLPRRMTAKRKAAVRPTLVSIAVPHAERPTATPAAGRRCRGGRSSSPEGDRSARDVDALFSAPESLTCSEMFT
jgi:hypothetical protein